MPEKLLSTRSIVIYPNSMTEKELQKVQDSFQRSGIDAVAYFEMDRLLAGRDASNAFAYYFNQRAITNLVFFSKSNNQYATFITGFNGKDSFIDNNQLAWTAEDVDLTELLKKIYRASSNLTRGNFLISDYPETNLPVQVISGRRSEFFAIDLKVDPLAVPKTGDELIDKDLESIFSMYPFKFKFTDPGVPEKELRQKGFLYVLCFVHTEGSIAKEILGYDTSKPESAYVSVTYPQDATQPQLRNIPADMPVYKFYFKHIESGNVFLGTKWDADISWQQALRNHLMAFKTELKIN
ncbi:MAG TPA: hypothetical protein VFW11_14085 [Cyclobacteriaceae bacterium]|nr:hypothetical protein [Cyclobacteriaceae bacterium]